jgi:SagB-type dehydrogenase family enzyme
MNSLATRQVVADGVPLITMLEGGDRQAKPLQPLEPGGTLAISRFAWIRREGEAVIAETSLGPHAVVLEDARAQTLFLAFAAPRRPDADLAEQLHLPLEAALEVVSVLREASLLINQEQAAAEEEPPLAVWEFHDLLFHARSRPGRHRGRSGGTFRFLDRLAPAPALPPARWTETVALERPDFERLERDDPPLARVQSVRRSIRNYGERPLGISELGEFLSRVGRVEDYWETPIPGPQPNSIAFVAKPYPSGGSLYELELYTAVSACDGLEPGLYHYEAGVHRLARASAATAELADLLSQGAAEMGTATSSMQVMIVITARFARLAWKYEAIAYELVLKHVGALLQTMYLVSTAMGLAPCAIGTGDSDLFARASGIAYYEESAVGEFALGSRSIAGPLGR